MKPALRHVGFAALAISAAIAIVVLDFLWYSGQFRTLTPHFAGSCAAVPLQASAEDIQIDRPRGVAYLSYLDRRAQIAGKPVLGTVMLLDLSLPEPRPRSALTTEPANFRPHGMSLYRAGDGSQRLFVISHPPDAPHRIEIFEQSPTGAFAPVRSITDPLLVAPDAVLAVGPNQFYVINNSGAHSNLGRALEILFRRGLSTLLFFDGEKFRIVDNGIKSGAGIALSLDGARIYVGETADKRLRVYSRKPASGDVSLVDTIDLGSAPANINVAGDGSIWVAAHANMLALYRHFRDRAVRVPTQIFRLQDGGSGPAQLTEVYLNDGGQISAGSVAAASGNELLIGSITEHKILRCRIP